VGFLGKCDKWQEVYLAKMNETLTRLRKEGIVGCVFDVDGVSWTNDIIGFAGHAAIRMHFIDGTNIYVDDTNWGGSDHVFLDNEVPGWRYTKDTPERAIFALHPEIKEKCKSSGKSCVDLLCDLRC